MHLFCATESLLKLRKQKRSGLKSEKKMSGPSSGPSFNFFYGPGESGPEKSGQCRPLIETDPLPS